VGGHTVEYLGSRTVERPNRVEMIADVRVNGGQVYEPSLNRYRQSGQTVPTPSVRAGLRDDVMLAVTRAPTDADTAVGLRVIVQPMVTWLWIGGLVMVLGTALSLFPGRRRNPLDAVSAPAPIEQPA
jgi:cytochrome c-type biogenesis protein CcmF